MASPVTIQPATADTYLRSNAADTNYSTAANFNVAHVSTIYYHALLSFDFSASVPEGATITLATLSLYFAGTGSGNTVACYRLRRTDWIPAEATWNHYKGTTDWGTAGAINTDTDHDTTDGASSNTPEAGAWQDWTVTAQVQTALDSVAGVAHFYLEYTGASANLQYSSSEDTTPSLRPKLTIEYKIPPFVNIGDDWKGIDFAGSKINIGDSWKAVRTVKVNIGDAWKRAYSSPAVLNEDGTYILLESGTDDRIEVE
jgi:hypothetical protein